MTLTLDTVIVASRDQNSTDLADEVVILHLKNGTYFGLNAVGAHIWKLIQKPTTIRAICESVQQEYSVEQAQCEADTLKLIADLVAQELAETA